MHANVQTRDHVREALKRADDLTAKARRDGRALSAAESDEVRSILSAVEQFTADDEMRARIYKSQTAAGRSTFTDRATGGDTPGDAFVTSQAYESLQGAIKSGALGGSWTSGPVSIPAFHEARAKATLMTPDFPFEPDVRPGVQELPQRPITITNLFAQGVTDSAVVRVVQETTFTNGAATVAEGAPKPESALSFDSVDEPVRKVATFLPVSDEFLEDGAAVRSFIDSRLRLAVQLTEETQLLAGDGTGSNLRGLLTRTGLQSLALTAPTSGANPGIAEALYTAITNVRVNALVEPDGIVLHPTNYAALRLAKDSNDSFNAGGPFGALAGDRVWGLPVALSHALPVNTALVGAFRSQAQVFRRNGLTVEVSNSHADFFRHNLTALRAELRVALCVYRPSAFHVVTGLQHAGVTAA